MFEVLQKKIFTKKKSFIKKIFLHQKKVLHKKLYPNFFLFKKIFTIKNFFTVKTLQHKKFTKYKEDVCIKQLTLLSPEIYLCDFLQKNKFSQRKKSFIKTFFLTKKNSTQKISQMTKRQSA